MTDTERINNNDLLQEDTHEPNNAEITTPESSPEYDESLFGLNVLTNYTEFDGDSYEQNTFLSQFAFFESQAWKHFECVCSFMFLQSMTFLSIMFLTFTIFQIASLFSGKGMTLFQIPTTYLTALCVVGFVRTFVDYFEYVYVIPQLEQQLRDSTIIKYIPFGTGVLLIILAYYNIFNGFYSKFTIVQAGGIFHDEDSFWFVTSIFYVFYFITSICVSDSRRTIFLHQMIQNMLGLSLALKLSGLGENCGLLLLFKRVESSKVITCFIVSILIMSLSYVILSQKLFSVIEMSPGTKTTELLWGLLSSYEIVDLYLSMKASHHLGLACIKFHGKIALNISISARLIFGHFKLEPASETH